MMRAKASLIFLLAILTSIAVTQTATAQDLAAKVLGIGGRKINVEFIPENACAAAVAFPKAVAENPKYDVLPREIATAWGIKEFGFDPMLIEQITFVVKQIDGFAGPPEWAAVLHFEKMQGLNGALVNRLEQKRIGDRTLFSGTAQGLPSFLVFDESTMLVGDESFFKDMITADKKGGLVRLIRGRSIKGELMAFVNVEAIRPALNEGTQMIPGMLPPAITKLKSIPDMVKAIEYGVSFDPEPNTDLVIHAIDDETAEKVGKIISNAVEFGREMAIGGMAAQMDFDDPVQEAMVEYAQRMGEEYQQVLTPNINGNRMNINLDPQVTMAPVLVGMLLPAVQQVREAARRTQSMNNMRQQTLAALNYDSAYGHLPTQANYDKNGKPLLSWRVHMLPFMEQQALYDQFHLDEPWDSPHNKKLISKMPEIYMNPSVGDLQGKTVYLGAAGEGMIFGKDKKKFSDLTDGSSNTIMFVQVDRQNAVEWTKPQDFVPNKNNPTQGVGGVHPGGFTVTFADGSTSFISQNIDPEIFKSMLSTQGGEAINRNDY